MSEYIAWVEVAPPRSGPRVKWYICGDHTESVDWAPERPEIAFRYPTHKAAMRALYATTDWAEHHYPVLGTARVDE